MRIASAFPKGNIRKRNYWQTVFTELGFPLWASLAWVFRDSRWDYFYDLWHLFAQLPLMLYEDGWVGLGGFGLGCEGGACEDGG